MGPLRLRDGRHGYPEQMMSEAAKKLRKLDTPYARSLALDCDEHADLPYPADEDDADQDEHAEYPVSDDDDEDTGEDD